MRSAFTGLITLFAATLVIAVLPQPTAAQPGSSKIIAECSRCTSCKKCKANKWGGNHCSMKGGCCNEGGGNCNPTQAMNTDPDDELLVGDELLVRLAGNLFGTWNCEDGQLRIAYAVDTDGEATQVSEAVMDDLRHRYPLARHLRLHRQDMRADGAL